MGRATGFEPATFGTTIQRSNQLSYARRGIKHFGGSTVFRSRVKRLTAPQAPWSAEALPLLCYAEALLPPWVLRLN